MKFMEHWGSGIPRIIDTVQAYGLPEPEFVDGDVYLRISVFRLPGNISEPNGLNCEPISEPNEPDCEPIEPLLENSLLELLHNNSKISQKKMVEELHASVSTIKRCLKRLQESGKLARDGNKRSGRWIINQ